MSDDIQVTNSAIEIGEELSNYDTNSGDDTEIVSGLEDPQVLEAQRAHHHIQSVGRRKEAIARVQLKPGTGQVTVNKKDLSDYFPNKVHQQIIKSPFVRTQREENYDVIAKIQGGGQSGQAGALRLAIARALIVATPEDRAVLKKAGFLTRDARMVERKKYGLKKARKASQYSKR